MTDENFAENEDQKEANLQQEHSKEERETIKKRYSDHKRISLLLPPHLRDKLAAIAEEMIARDLLDPLEIDTTKIVQVCIEALAIGRTNYKQALDNLQAEKEKIARAKKRKAKRKIADN